MSFPTMNAQVVSMVVTHSEGGGTPGKPYLATGVQYPLFSVPAVVDVSGMEFALALGVAGGTTLAVSIASGASTVEFQFGDAGTTATGTASGNHLINADDLSNTVTGGWSAHLARTAVGTSTTDLDADDWVRLHTVANLSTVAGFGSAVVKAAFVYGKPGAIN